MAPEKKTLILPCPLTENRRVDLQNELIESTNLYERTDEMKKRMAAEHTNVLKINRRKMALAAKTLEQGYELKPVECERTFRNGKIVVVRLDTGATIGEREYSSKDFE